MKLPKTHDNWFEILSLISSCLTVKECSPVSGSLQWLPLSPSYPRSRGKQSATPRPSQQQAGVAMRPTVPACASLCASHPVQMITASGQSYAAPSSDCSGWRSLSITPLPQWRWTNRRPGTRVQFQTIYVGLTLSPTTSLWERWTVRGLGRPPWRVWRRTCPCQ